MMPQHLQELDVLTLQTIFLNNCKEFREATKKRISLDELSRMYESVKEVYTALSIKKRLAEPALREAAWS